MSVKITNHKYTMLWGPRFTYHKKYEPKIWASPDKMSAGAHAALVAVINQLMRAFKSLNIPLDVCDVFVHGSVTHLYYSPKSDIDLCFVCDFSRLNKELPNQNKILLLKSVAKSVLAETSPRIYGRDIDVEFVDVNNHQYGHKHYKVGGSYSVLMNKWTHRAIMPTQSEIKQICCKAKQIYKQMRRDMLKLLIDNADYKQIEDFTTNLMRNRKIAYAENPLQPITPYIVAYRMFRSSGLLQRAYSHALKLRAINP